MFFSSTSNTYSVSLFSSTMKTSKLSNCWWRVLLMMSLVSVITKWLVDSDVLYRRCTLLQTQVAQIVHFVCLRENEKITLVRTAVFLELGSQKIETWAWKLKRRPLCVNVVLDFLWKLLVQKLSLFKSWKIDVLCNNFRLEPYIKILTTRLLKRINTLIWIVSKWNSEYWILRKKSIHFFTNRPLVVVMFSFTTWFISYL